MKPKNPATPDKGELKHSALITLKAKAGCNLHGIWTSTLKV